VEVAETTPNSRGGCKNNTTPREAEDSRKKSPGKAKLRIENGSIIGSKIDKNKSRKGGRGGSLGLISQGIVQSQGLGHVSEGVVK